LSPIDITTFVVNWQANVIGKSIKKLV